MQKFKELLPSDSKSEFTAMADEGKAIAKASLQVASDAMDVAAQVMATGMGPTAELPLEALRCLGELASCLLLTRDYDGALAALTQAQLLAQAGPSPPSGAFLEVLVRCEVSRVLLLLLLQPPPPKLQPEHAQTLEKYCWEAFESGAGAGQLPQAGYLPPGLFLLLQSTVMACQEKDLEALKVLQAELWPLLSPEQNHLLHLVLQEMISPSGHGA
ncbi:Factor VIII intron 22 protein [Chelonia mydas]|uniref:Factor VIII intron 22 protein n=1 Tax=Chelonia mydas TaxID=8469 RepID=M7C3W3_CHEMY|nr:Factor VIII intron 22 protein [Chelonia mydas]